MSTTRTDGRAPEAMRPISFQRRFTSKTPGSVLASFGDTRVLCTASLMDGVPRFLQGKGKGWLTAEYSMLPSSTDTRKARDRSGRVDGRSVEIQRLIGRSVRAVTNLEVFGERTIYIDCDVLQADGGTRTTSISGAWVALHDLFLHMDSKRLLREWPLEQQLGAVSIGAIDGEVLCDLCYTEDAGADVDMNVVMTSDGEFVEVQGGAEGATFSRETLESMLACAEGGIRQIFEAQRAAVEEG
jgi:ribonuclease PH